MMKLVFWRGKRGKSAGERAKDAKSRDSFLEASISYLLWRMTHLILICAKLFLASPSPNEISGPLERAEGLRGVTGL